ncbi:MAG TPA: tetratricopeptide repeat protein, partial [Desulfatiglandales bacterium]|nr:tetratricopeptide repeat protein [Desulfatiglandales bacterium]
RDRRNALSYLEKIPEDSFAASYKYEIIGDIMLGEGQIKDAISAYQRSLEINSGRREVRTKLIKVYWRTDREKAMKEYDTLEYIISFYPREMLES